MERSTAYKLWLSELNEKELIKQQEEYAPSYIETEGKKISRINLIATVINKNQKENFSSITLDDGSAQIRAKTWGDDNKLLQDIKIGDCALVIGKLKEYDSELYITPEIVKKQDINWYLLRIHELATTRGKPPQLEYKEDQDFPESGHSEDRLEIKEETIHPQESARQKILDTIASLETETGALIESVIQKSGINEDEANNILRELLQEGEIFKISSNKVKIT